MNRKGYTYDYEKDIYTDWQGRLANMPEFQFPEPTALMSAKNYKTKIVEPLIQKLKKAILDISAKYYDLRDRYYDLRSEIGGLREENSRLERKIQDLREENAVLREDVKNLKILKKAYGSRKMEDLLNDAVRIKSEKEYDAR